MDSHVDISWTRGDTSQNSLAQSFTADHEHGPGNTAPDEDSFPDDLNPFPSNVHLSLVTDGGDVVAHEGQTLIHPFKSDREPSDVQAAVNRIDQEHGCTHPESNSDQVILPAISNEIRPSDRTVVSAGGFTSLALTNTSDSGAHAIVPPQGPPLLCARTVSSAITLRGEGEADSVDHLKCSEMPYTELDHVHSDGLAHLTDEEETRENLNYPFEDRLCPLPPSSSPPQLFSSSPYASSQSSASSIEPSKMMLAVEAEDRTSSQDCPRSDHVISIAQDESRLESRNLHSHNITDVTTSPETDKDCFQVDPITPVEGGLAPSGKRIGHQNDPDESQPIKRPKLDSDPHLPPTPKRATLASQHRQFKKLAAPFRPPSKLPIVADDAQTVNNREAELTISETPETSRDKIDMKENTANLLPSQHKAPNASRSVAQFKSPLISRDLSADTRTIRLTPALQTLERKLQLLKRAIKVKEEKDEEVLTGLAGKWIEAGREVAYDVWGATKDAGDFAGKTTSVRKSYGWESINDGNVHWGWDTKPGDASEESCGPDPSAAPWSAGRLDPEEDDVGCNTLGTMLRQLGIAPEVFGWDDEKESFSD